jgi:hypothetical protein
MRRAETQFRQIWGLSYNKSLLRAGTHKVLARGRAPSLSGRALCARALLRVGVRSLSSDVMRQRIVSSDFSELRDH